MSDLVLLEKDRERKKEERETRGKKASMANRAKCFRSDLAHKGESGLEMER